MTIAAGFRCRDGIVLCADSQFTIGDSIKLAHGLKIAHSREKEYSLLIAAAGVIDFAQSLWEEILRDVDGSDKGFETIKEIIGDNLVSFYARHIFPAPKWMGLNIGLLIGLWTKGGQVGFMKSTESVLLNAGDVEVSGSAMVLGRYLTSKLAERTIIPLSIEQAEAIAIHIVNQAKRFDPYCSGETRIRILRANGDIQQTTPDKIVQIEEFFEESERMLGYGLADMASGTMPDANFDQWFRDFSSNLKKLSDRVRRGRKED